MLRLLALLITGPVVGFVATTVLVDLGAFGSEPETVALLLHDRLRTLFVGLAMGGVTFGVLAQLGRVPEELGDDEPKDQRSGDRSRQVDRSVRAVRESRVVGETGTTREAKGGAIVTAMDRLGLDSRFFYDQRLGDSPRYRDHVRWTSTPDTKMPAAWDEFMKKHAPRLGLDPDEVAWLREIRTHRASAESYLQAIIIRRGGLEPADAARSASVTASAASIGEALGVPPFDPERH